MAKQTTRDYIWSVGLTLARRKEKFSTRDVARVFGNSEELPDPSRRTISDTLWSMVELEQLCVDTHGENYTEIDMN